MLDFSIIAGPVVGAAIGYVTNYIAVKMLFRPVKPVKIGNFTVPFTPGIIPKEKPRLAHGIGEIVGKNLVTKEVLEKALLSEEMKVSLNTGVQNKLAELNPELTILDAVAPYVPRDDISSISDEWTGKLAVHIKESLLASNIGGVLSTEIIKSVKTHLQGGFLSLMLNDSLLNSIGEYVTTGMNEYIENHGEAVLEPYIHNELENIQSIKVSDIIKKLEEHDIHVEEIICTGYEKAVKEDLSPFLERLDIAGLVEEQINDMDVLELEKLILSVMKKELNAIVNLGALIGFILGLINLLF